MKLKDIGEDKLIELLSKPFKGSESSRVLKAIGDDTSVTTQSEGHLLLSTTDILQEGVHFDLKYTTPFDLGVKSVNISTSDIASMGGVSMFLLMSLSLPEETDSSFVEELYRGIKSACNDYPDKVLTLVGGNSSLSKDSISIVSTVLGEIEKDKVVYRGGAQIGDKIFVTGTLGDSGLGLKMLQADSNASNSAILRHKAPKSRREEGFILASNSIASSMIDLSDGLASDLSHIVKASSVGATINYDKIPLSSLMTSYLKENPSELELPLSGGEDYELLFTVPKTKLKTLESIRKTLPTAITEIGTVTTKDLIFLDSNNKPMALKNKGFKHF